MNFRLFSFLASTAILAFGLNASANVGEYLGFGPRIASLGGAGVAWGSGAYFAYHNPAGMALDSENRLQVNFGLVFVQPSFTSIGSVVTQNNFNSSQNSGSPTYGSVDTNYKPTFGQELAISYRAFPNLLNLTFGFASFIPLNQFAYMDTGETFLPEYVLYRGRTQRPQMELAAGVEFGKGFYAGAGAHCAFTLNSNGTLFLNKPGYTSSMRFNSSLTPKVAPYLGALFAPDKKFSNYSIGAVFRFPVSYDNTLTFNSSANVLLSTALDFNLLATSALLYDPMAIELGGSFRHFKWGRAYLQLDYQFWSNFQMPALNVQDTQSSLKLANTVMPTYTTQNIFVPRVGEEISISDVTSLRFGYAYRPSIFANLPTGPGNYLDPPKHMANAGVGLNYPHCFGFEKACQIDVNLTYHILVSQQINKVSGNELGDQNDFMLGYNAQGYTAGGNAIGGGASLSIAL